MRELIYFYWLLAAFFFVIPFSYEKARILSFLAFHPWDKRHAHRIGKLGL